MAKVFVKINDSEFSTIEVNVAFVQNMHQLSNLVIDALNKTEDNLKIEKLLVYDSDFNEYVTVDNSATTKFFPRYNYRFHLSRCSSSELTPKINGLSTVRTLNVSHGGVITRQALGRIAAIGELYDAHEDEFCKQSAFGRDIKHHVVTTDTERTAAEYMVDASFGEKLKTFEASILSGMLEACGHGKYLSYTKSSSKELNASLICRMSTKHESLDISKKAVADAISKNAIERNTNATHIVTGIQWGAGAVANATFKSENDEPYNVIKTKLILALTALRFPYGKGGCNVENVENEVFGKNNFTLKFFADALPNGEDLPQTMEEAIAFMKKLPNLIKYANNGKGVPVVYSLTPISILGSSVYDRIIQNLDTRLIEEVVTIFEELDGSQRKLNDIKCYFFENSFCLSDTIFSTLILKIQELQTIHDNIRIDLRNTLIQVRYGKKGFTDVNYIIKNYRRSNVTPEGIKLFCSTFTSQYEKIGFAQNLRTKGVHYIDKKTTLDGFLCGKIAKEYFIFFCDWTVDKMRAENCDLFMKIPKTDVNDFIFVDIELTQKQQAYKGNQICQYVNGCYIDDNVFETQKNLHSKCIARCIGKFKPCQTRPNKRIDLYFPFDKMRDENCDLFMKIPKTDANDFIFVDMELTQKQQAYIGNQICQYVNGCYIDDNVFETQKNLHSKCIARCIGKFKPCQTRPNKRIDLYFPCPQSFHHRYCENEDHEWLCYICQTPVQYGFDENFYCRCGMESMFKFVFRCSHPKHGVAYIHFDKKMIKDLAENLRSNKELNILLLGETGVGKSTFINGIANYLRYDTLEEAAMSPLCCLIPTQFNITDINRKSKTIKTGESKNESFRKGESGTQEPLCHTFRVGEKIIRLIDTPGIGDTRGAKADADNFAAILKYISYHNEIHGICILLKPNNSKMSVLFKYCINELLVHLHKSAAANIAFCFTNSRSTFYSPGDTMPVLERYIENMQDIHISLTKETTYCFDNEAFRFLCCLNNGEKFDDKTRNTYEDSWRISVEETLRLFSHFENDVKPHIAGETISLNDARRIILTAAKPLADITGIIQENIDLIEEQKKEVARYDKTELKLKGKLLVKHIGLEAVKLGYPRTLSNSNLDQVVYKTICHSPCKLSDVIPEKAPNPKLQNCTAMNDYLKCKECGCGWEMHMHITYEQQKVIKEYEDETVKECLSENKSAKETQEQAIKSLENTIQQYKRDQSDIDQMLARFASFLKKNAIMTYNDAIEDYLEMSINIAKQQSKRLKNRALIEQMEKQLSNYKEEKRILDARLNEGKIAEVQAKEIKEMLAKLEALPMTGKNIKALIDATKHGQETNYIYHEKHHAPFTPAPKMKKKKEKNGFFKNLFSDEYKEPQIWEHQHFYHF
uniref:G domain-containing protein n=1 Tax=Panagrolaimus sp. ES5 TaxID=591445 RepID=A0AC34FE27_9BILA